jgi:hypothetical protein
MEQTIQYETKMQEIREKNEQKMVEQREKDHQRQLELERKKREVWNNANSGGFTKERERIITAKEARTRAITDKSTSAIISIKGEIGERKRAAKATRKGRESTSNRVTTKAEARIV